MKKAYFIGLTVVFTALAGCSSQKTLTYSVQTNIPDSGKSAEIFQASERVMSRRLPGYDVKDSQVKVVPTGSGSALMTIKVPNAAGVKIAQSLLSEVFTFDIRLEGPPTPTTPKGETNWLATGVDGSMLIWVTAISNPETQEIGVELHFNEVGHELLETTFKGNKNKHVGIFVRDLLVSKMTISTEKVTDHIIISGIPSERVAQIFADDVNVGLHAIFTQTK